MKPIKCNICKRLLPRGMEYKQIYVRGAQFPHYSLYGFTQIVCKDCEKKHQDKVNQYIEAVNKWNATGSIESILSS